MLLSKKRPETEEIFKIKSEDNTMLTKTKTVRERLVVCFEPSPDALVAVASSFGGALGVPDEVTAEFSSAISEQASNIGMRTHTVTLLREGLYRACEAYATGVIGQWEYKQILDGYGALVVTMMAIEQVSGLQQTPKIIIAPGKAEAEVETDTRDGADGQPTVNTSSSAMAGADNVTYNVTYTVNPLSRENAIVVRQLAGTYLLYQIGAMGESTNLLDSENVTI